jgi:hypothetical protein
MENNSDKIYLKTKEAAEYLRLTPQTLERLRFRGGSPIYAKIGKIIVYDIDDLKVWVNSKKQSCTRQSLTENYDKSLH